MSSTHPALKSCRLGLVAIAVLVVSACSNGGSSGPEPASSSLALAGSVGDGPVANAIITLEDVNGEVIGTTTSDASAKYSFEIPAGTLLPVTVRATGGIDMVTGRALDFDLVAVANINGDATVNLTPQSTLTVATANCLNNDLTTEGLRQTWRSSRAQIGMGMDAELLPDPMSQTIDASNAANVVLATEALGETIRRTMEALSQGSGDSVDGDSVIAELGCDMAYSGKIDGVWSQGVMRTGAVYRAAEAAVLVEVIAGDLQVDGASATALMDQAVSSIVEPGTVAQSVTDVPLDDTLVDQALESVLLMQSVNSSDVALLGLVDVLVETQPSELRSMMRSQLGSGLSNSFGALSANLANPSIAAASDLAESAALQRENRAPYIALTVDDDAVTQGESTRVSWASSSADRCLASGSEDWSGPVSLSGRFFAENLQHSTQFELRCYGAGGINRAAIKVLVNNDNGQSIEDPLDVAQRPDPSDGAGNPANGAEVEAPIAGVDDGANDDAPDAPDAPDAGTGATERNDPIPTEDPVNTANQVVVSWEAPHANTDGTVIDDLTGYRIFYGDRPSDYTEEAVVNDPQATELRLDLAPGLYYVAMTAIAGDGTQSDLSNEVLIESR